MDVQLAHHSDVLMDLAKQLKEDLQPKKDVKLLQNVKKLNHIYVLMEVVLDLLYYVEFSLLVKILNIDALINLVKLKENNVLLTITVILILQLDVIMVIVLMMYQDVNQVLKLNVQRVNRTTVVLEYALLHLVNVHYHITLMDSKPKKKKY
jgi:hypothetical protein